VTWHRWSGCLAVAVRAGAVAAQRAEVDVQVRVVRLGFKAEFVGGVLAEAADALGQIGRDVGQVLGVDDVALLLELAHDLGDVQGVVEDHRVREQSVEFRGLLLLDGVVVGDDVATGISEDGGREVLGVMVGDSETEAFWSEFLRSLRERGLGGVRLVISDSHSGLVAAIRKVMLGAAWQRCRAHFLRNVFSVIPKGSGEMVAATIRTIFIQPTTQAAHHQLDAVADMLGQQLPKVRQMLLDAKEDLTAFAAFPISHWKKIQSSNPLERINREIKRRTDVVQVFPKSAALERLVTAVLSEMHDEWIAFPRRYLSEASMTAIYADEHADHTTRALSNTPNTTDD